MADVPVAPAVARSRSIGGRLNSAPGQLRYRQTVDDRGGARHCSVLERRLWAGIRGVQDGVELA